jgi:hypothetical protein
VGEPRRRSPRAATSRAAPSRRTYPRRISARMGSGTRVIADSTPSLIPLHDWLGGEGGDPRGAAERRGNDLLRSNAGLLRDMHLSAQVVRHRGEPHLAIEASTHIGAIPLRSPLSGRADYGLIVQPRFPWSGVGDLLATTGFRVTPDLLPLPDLPQSERAIPPWVLASVMLQRLEALLAAQARRFVMTEADLRAPRGAVDWRTYASRRLPFGQSLAVPCRFPDLRDDETLRAAIHWSVRRTRESLQAAPEAGQVARGLIGRCDRLIAQLAGTPPKVPDARLRSAWRRLPLMPRAFSDGIHAIDTTIDQRGLAGPSDLSGLAWRLDMATLFEAWVEAIAERVARRIGATLRSGRTGGTRVAVDWRPPGSGSQGSFLPDVVLQRDDLVVILDAKYKRHASDIERLGWTGVGDALREQHRGDLMQALAYAALFNAQRIVTLLIYPTTVPQYRSARDRQRSVALGRLRLAGRNVEVGVVAVPLGGDAAAVGSALERALRGDADINRGSADSAPQGT